MEEFSAEGSAVAVWEVRTSETKKENCSVETFRVINFTYRLG